MFISPTIALNNNWIVAPTWMDEDYRSKCIQPNALDITLDRAFLPVESSSNNSFILTEQTKQMSQFAELTPQSGLAYLPDTCNSGILNAYENCFIIPPGGMIDCMSDFFVNVPENTAAYLIVRSTLNRNGIFLTSGLYDAGFSNKIGFILHNRSELPAYIGVHTRVAQIIFVESQTLTGLYGGSYNSNPGDHWAVKQ